MLAALCNDPITLAFLRSASFKTAKRPITKALLQRIDLLAILKRTDRRALSKRARDIHERELGVGPGKAIPERDRPSRTGIRADDGPRRNSAATAASHPFHVPDRAMRTSDGPRHSGPRSGKRSLMKHLQVVVGIMLIGLISGTAAGGEPEQKQPDAVKLKTRNILLVTSDGLRWQEVFGGADLALLNKEDGGVANPSLLKSESRRRQARGCAGSCSCRFSGPRSPRTGRSSATSTRAARSGSRTARTSHTPATTKSSPAWPTPRSTATTRYPTRM